MTRTEYIKFCDQFVVRCRKCGAVTIPMPPHERDDAEGRVTGEFKCPKCDVEPIVMHAPNHADIGFPNGTHMTNPSDFKRLMGDDECQDANRGLYETHEIPICEKCGTSNPRRTIVEKKKKNRLIAEVKTRIALVEYISPHEVAFISPMCPSCHVGALGEWTSKVDAKVRDRNDVYPCPKCGINMQMDLPDNLDVVESDYACYRYDPEIPVEERDLHSPNFVSPICPDCRVSCVDPGGEGYINNNEHEHDIYTCETCNRKVQMRGAKKR